MKDKYKVHLCKGCIESLEEHFPYTIPRDQVEVIEVPTEECDNYEANLPNYNQRLRERNPDWATDPVLVDCPRCDTPVDYGAFDAPMSPITCPFCGCIFTPEIKEDTDHDS